MAAPSATARQQPSGILLESGHRTFITFSRNPSVKFEEVTVTRAGMDGQEPIRMTTMFNTKLETFAPRRLTKITDGTMKVLYDPQVEEDIFNDLINRNNVITETHPDGSTRAFWGYLRSFVPDENSEPNAPMATVTFTATNRDDSGDYQEPVVTEVSGT